MQTLTYGMQLPETGDIGSDFFPALEDNITLADGHTHNGSNSAKLSGSSVLAYTQAILSAAWVAVAGVTGLYKQTVSISGGLQYNDYFPRFKLTTLGHIVDLSVEKVSATSYTVYINDNTLDITAYYLN